MFVVVFRVIIEIIVKIRIIYEVIEGVIIINFKGKYVRFRFKCIYIKCKGIEYFD